MKDKVSEEDFSILKENFGQLNSKVSFMKEHLEQLFEDRKILDEIVFIRRKMENFTLAISKLKSEGSNSPNRHLRNSSVDNKKFLDLVAFEEFAVKVWKEIDEGKRMCDDVRRLSDDILELVKDKIAVEDLKKFEEFMKLKIEEVKLFSVKKFSDKTETTKNHKYLEQQVAL